MLAHIFCSLLALIPLPENHPPLKTSVIIPCYYGHLQYLDPLLDLLSYQTERPDEVVISISEIDRADRTLLQELFEKKSPFPIKIVTHQEKLWAGFNRNAACSVATGDILICQDADDIPHPQRIEVINYFFKNFEVDLLIHKWIGMEEEPLFYNSWFNKEEIASTFITKALQFKTSGPIHNGNNAISARVFKRCKWSNQPLAEDYAFNRSVAKIFKNSIIINAGLLLYRTKLSSFATP